MIYYDKINKMTTKLSEVDKLLLKIDTIYTDLGGEADPNYFDTSKVKDKYEKLRVEVNRLIGEVESLLNEKDQLNNDADKIQQKYILDGKAESKIEELSKKLKELETEMKAQKKKSSKEDFSAKQNMLDSLNKRYLFIKNRYDGVPFEAEEYKDNVAQIDQLDQIILKQSGPERELYQEEKDKMDEWDERKKQQDNALRNIHKDIKGLKVDAKDIGKEINNVGKAIKDTQKKAEETNQKLETSNKKLKDMLEKIRGSDKICLDIVLICICLGLAAVLYNLIKNNLMSSDEETPETEQAQGRMLKMLGF